MVKDKEERTRKKPGRVYARGSLRSTYILSLCADRLHVPNVEGSNCAAIKMLVNPPTQKTLSHYNSQVPCGKCVSRYLRWFFGQTNRLNVLQRVWKHLPRWCVIFFHAFGAVLNHSRSSYFWYVVPRVFFGARTHPTLDHLRQRKSVPHFVRPRMPY